MHCSIKSLLIACLAVALLPAAAPNRAAAQTAILDLVPVVTCTATSGSSPNICGGAQKLQDKISGNSYSFPSGTTFPAVTTAVSAGITTGRLSWFQMPANGQIVVNLGTPIPTSNTTIKIRKITPAHPSFVYSSLLTLSQQANPGVTLFSLGKRGPNYTFGRILENFSTTSQGFWMTPWDPVDLPSVYTTSPVPTYVDIYYTFLPDGRMRLDAFKPVLNSANATDPNHPGLVVYGSNWQEGTQDGGWPQANLDGEVPDNNNVLPFVKASNQIAIGKESTTSKSIFPSNEVPSASPDQIVEIVIYNSALTPAQLISLTNADVGMASPSLVSTNPLLPCNTGQWMPPIPPETRSTVYTPCGSGSPGHPIAAALRTDAHPYTQSHAASFTRLNVSAGGSKTDISFNPPPYVNTLTGNTDPSSWVVSSECNGGTYNTGSYNGSRPINTSLTGVLTSSCHLFFSSSYTAVGGQDYPDAFISVPVPSVTQAVWEPRELELVGDQKGISTLVNTGNTSITLSNTYTFNQPPRYGYFVYDGGTCLGATLAPGASCIAEITYICYGTNWEHPRTSRSQFNVESTTGTKYSIVLYGINVVAAAHNPSLSLSTTAMEAPGEVTLSNMGATPLNLNMEIAGTDAIDFSETDNCNGTLAPGASCTMSISFEDVDRADPRQGANATITIKSNDPASPAYINLQGQTQ